MAQDIRAPLAGKIIGVSIKAGQKIEEDDEAFVIESMKMENPIYAPCGGTVKEVKAREGDTVQENDVLAVIG